MTSFDAIEERHTPGSHSEPGAGIGRPMRVWGGEVVDRTPPLEENGFQYGTRPDGSIRIEKYVGANTAPHVPGRIDGSPVKVIGKKAFMNTGIVSVVLPDSLEIIEEFAFSGCRDLGRIHFPRSVKSVGPSAFSGCEGLVEVSRESEDVVYGKNAFYRCARLKSFTIPNGMKAVPQALLARCSSLVDVTIPEGTLSLGQAVFGQDYALRKIHFPESLTAIDSEVLTYLTDITVRVKRGSYAENFCKEHGYAVEIVE